MIWFVIFSMAWIAAYVTAVCIKSKGIPASISATFYTLEHKAWFLVAMWGTAGLLMPAILEVGKPGTAFLAFLACAGMMAVGAAPNFKAEFEGDVHTAGAALSLLYSQIWVACNCPWSLTLWAAYLAGTLEAMRRGKTFMETRPLFWMELCALAGTFISVFILV